MAQVLAREGIDCDYRKGGALYCAARYPEQEVSLRRYLDKLYAQGLTEDDYRWLSPQQLAEQVRIAKPYGGIYAPTSRRSTRQSWCVAWRGRLRTWA